MTARQFRRLNFALDKLTSAHCQLGTGPASMPTPKRFVGVTREVDFRKCTIRLSLPIVNKATHYCLQPHNSRK